MDYNFIYLIICTSYDSKRVTEAYFSKESAQEICEIRNSNAKMDGASRTYSVEEVFITDAPV